MKNIYCQANALTIYTKQFMKNLYTYPWRLNTGTKGYIIVIAR